MTKKKTVVKTDEISLDYALVTAIQKGAVPQKDLRFVMDKANPIKDRQERFANLKFKNKDAIEQLWQKYTLLTKKMKFKLIRTARNHNMAMDQWFEDYESRAYERFMWSVCVVRLDDCAHLMNQWVIYQHYWGNLMAMNRDLIKEFIVKSDHECQIHGIGSEDEESSITNVDREIGHSDFDLSDDIIKSEEKSLFWDSWRLTENRMAPQQIQIIKCLRSGMTPKATREKLGITQKCLKNEIEAVKNLFDLMTRSLSKGRGDKINLTEMTRKWA
jgi:hypothetical protein